MGNKKISELADAATITGTETSELVQSGANVKISETVKKTYYSGYKGKWSTNDTLPGSLTTKETDYVIVGPAGWSYAPTSEFWPYGTEIKALIDTPGTNRDNYAIR